MTPDDEALIHHFSSAVTKDLTLHLRLTSDAPQGFTDFCRILSTFIPHVHIQTANNAAYPLPSIQIISGLDYHAIPTGKKLELFFEAIMVANALKPPPDLPLDHIHLPAHMDLYIADQCPYCPGVLKHLLPLPILNSAINLHVIDTGVFPEAAHKQHVQSVPTLIIDDRFRFTGPITLSEIIAVLSDRRPAQLSTQTLKNLLQDGRASDIARMMREANEIFPAFLPLLIHTKWPIRLGAMVVIEELAATDVQLATQCIPALWEKFPYLDDTVKGDILYLCGEAGTIDIIPKIDTVLHETDNAELKAAAQDAISEIRARFL